MDDLKRHILEIPDFPRPGILFRDISPLLRSHFDATLNALDALISASEWAEFDAVAWGVGGR